MEHLRRHRRIVLSLRRERDTGYDLQLIHHDLLCLEAPAVGAALGEVAFEEEAVS